MLILSVFMAIASISTTEIKAQVSVGADITFNVFHNGLSAYGRWVNNPTYGQVWICSEPGFVPYRTNGHWVYTDDGWTWVSDYSWGWAPFHYGRWDYDVAYGGYYWVPGYEWGPAWVSWRSDNSDYGWAPLRPGVSIGIGISFGDDIPAERWTFVPNRYIASPEVSHYYVDNRKNVTIIRNTTIINNVHNNNSRVAVIGGPRRADVERVTHTRVSTYAVANSGRAGDTRIEKNTVNIYRPVVNKTTVVNKEVVNNNRTVINRNSNNKTVVKNSNNKVINNNQKKVTTNKRATTNNKTVVNKNRNTINSSNKTTVRKNTAKSSVTNKSTVNRNNKTVNNNHKSVVKRPAQKQNKMTNKPSQKQQPKSHKKPGNN